MLHIIQEYIKEIEVELPLAIQDRVDEFMEHAADEFMKILH